MFGKKSLQQRFGLTEEEEGDSYLRGRVCTNVCNEVKEVHLCFNSQSRHGGRSDGRRLLR